MGAGTMQKGSGPSRRMRGRVRSQPMSEINVTPFVDVMLVLLIIFMVAAPLLTVGVPVQLPETSAKALEQSDEEPLTLTLQSDGTIILQESEVPRDRLLIVLEAIINQRGGDDKIFVRGDTELPYGEAMVVIGALNAAGYRNIGLVTEGGGPTLEGGDGAAVGGGE